MKIAVVGTGYVGLVTGTCLAETGNQVICVDINEQKVEMMKFGKLPIYEPGLELLFLRNITQKRLHFTTNLAEAIEEAQIIFLALPTPPGGKYLTIGGGWAIVANAKGSNPKAAGEFASWALGSPKAEE